MKSTKGAVVVPADSKAKAKPDSKDPKSKRPKKKDQPEEIVPFSQLFIFMDGWDKLMMSISVLFGLSVGAVIPMTSWALGGILNAAASPDKFEDEVNKAVLWQGCLAAAAFITQGGGTYLAIWSSERQTHRIRQAYFRGLLRQEVSYMEQVGINQAATRLSEDTLAIQEGIGAKLFLLISGFAQFWGSMILGFTVSKSSWMLALTIFALVPAIIVVFGLLVKVIQRLSGNSDNAYAKAGEVLNESLTMIKTVAAFGGEEHEVTRYDRYLETAQNEGFKNGIINGASRGVFVGTLCAFYGVGLYAGARFIALNREWYPECTYNPTASYDCFGGGTVIQTMFAIIGGAAAMGVVGPNISYIARAKSAAFQIFKIIDRKPSIDPYANDGVKVNKDTFKAKIEFRNVNFTYPTRPLEPVLKDFNLVIEPGTSVALVGSSGSGKSTIIALLQRWYAPNSGQILIDDIPIENYNTSWFRSQQALVSQEPQLMPLSIKDNIGAGLDCGTDCEGVVSDKDVVEAAKAASAHDFIMTLPNKYNTKVSSGQLSGGQKQRICIARAIIRKAKILLLDEATSALDSASERIIQADLDKILASGGRTAIMIAHRLSTVTGVDQIVVMQGGVVVENGKHDELLAKGVETGAYARLWAAQALVGTSNAALLAANRSNATLTNVDVVIDPNGTDVVAAADPAATAASTDGTDQQKKRAGSSDNDNDMGGAVEEVDPKKKALVLVESLEDPKKNDRWKSLPQVPFSRWWKYQSPEIGWIILGCICAAIGGGVTPAFAVLLTKFITIFFNPNSQEMIDQSLNYLAFFFAIAGITLIFNIVQGYSWAQAGERFVRRMRKDAYMSLISQAVNFYDIQENSVGRLGARVGINAAKMKLALGDKLGEKIQAVSTLAIGIGISFNASWVLTLIVLALSPILVATSSKENNVNFTQQEELKEGLAEAANVASDATNAIRVVHSFGLQDALVKKFTTAIQPQYKAARKNALLKGVSFGAQQFIQPLIMAVVFYAGIQLQQTNNAVVSVTFEQIVQVYFAFQFSTFSLINIMTLFSDLVVIKGAIRSLVALIDRKTEIDGTEAFALASQLQVTVDGQPLVPLAATGNSVSPASATTTEEVAIDATFGRIEFRDVQFTYPARPEAPVLNGLNLVIERGQTVGIVGPSGSGKSSVIQLLLRFYDPSAGTVFVDGKDIRTVAARHLREGMGWVQQEAPLFADSIAYNVAYGRSGGLKNKPEAGKGVGRVEGVKKEGQEEEEEEEEVAVPADFTPGEDVKQTAADANMYEYVDRFKHGLATYVGERGSGISGGQKQRVALARALIRKPRILILDEATSALDSESEKIVQASIDKLLSSEEEKKRTTIMIAHRLSTIAKCDVIFVVDKGVVVEKGNFNDLISNERGLFRKLADAQGLVINEGEVVTAKEVTVVRS